MRFTHARVLAAASQLALAGAASTALMAAGPASATPSQVVAVGCDGRGQVRPTGFDNFGCMPSQELLTGLHWTSWRSAAFGHGTLKVNDCTDLRPGQVHQVPGPDGPVAAQAMAAARRPGLLQPAHLDLHG
jgi:hypothetical protein